jgi:hypothetical protein
VKAIAVGDLMSAALHDGKLTVWGFPSEWGDSLPFHGELDVGLDIADIAVGDVGVLALLSNGSLVAYSYTNYYLKVPGAITGARVASIASCAGGSRFVAVLVGTGELVAWVASTGIPYWVPVEARAGVAAAACGGGRAVALLSNGSIVAWYLLDETAGDGVQLLAERGLRVAMGFELILAVVRGGDGVGSEDNLSKDILLLVVSQASLLLDPCANDAIVAEVVVLMVTLAGVKVFIVSCRSDGIREVCQQGTSASPLVRPGRHCRIGSRHAACGTAHPQRAGCAVGGPQVFE